MAHSQHPSRTSPLLNGEKKPSSKIREKRTPCRRKNKHESLTGDKLSVSEHNSGVAGVRWESWGGIWREVGFMTRNLNFLPSSKESDWSIFTGNNII